MKIEHRFALNDGVSVKGRQLVGRAVVYDETTDLGSFKERILPGAFTDSLALAKRSGDILALVDHSIEKVLGRTKSGSLRLKETRDGVDFEIDVPDTSIGRDTLALAERGDLGGASVGMIVEDEIQDAGVRVIRRSALLEISLVSAWPAYAGTSVEARRGYSFRPVSDGLTCQPTPRLHALRRYLETV